MVSACSGNVHADTASEDLEPQCLCFLLRPEYLYLCRVGAMAWAYLPFLPAKVHLGLLVHLAQLRPVPLSLPARRLMHFEYALEEGRQRDLHVVHFVVGQFSPFGARLA